MDHDRVDSLVSLVRNARDVSTAKQALAELAAALKGYAWSQFQKKKWPFIKTCDFDSLYRRALHLAVTTYDPRKGAQFATWCVRRLVYECTGEGRSHRKIVIDDIKKELSKLRSAPPRDPKDTCEQCEKLEIVTGALMEENERSRQAVMAWYQGGPPAKEIAGIWKIKPDSVHKIRSRNLMNMRRRIRQSVPGILNGE